jgi:hypothetical protein
MSLPRGALVILCALASPVAGAQAPLRAEVDILWRCIQPRPEEGSLREPGGLPAREVVTVPVEIGADASIRAPELVRLLESIQRKQLSPRRDLFYCRDNFMDEATAALEKQCEAAAPGNVPARRKSFLSACKRRIRKLVTPFAMSNSELGEASQYFPLPFLPGMPLPPGEAPKLNEAMDHLCPPGGADDPDAVNKRLAEAFYPAIVSEEAIRRLPAVLRDAAPVCRKLLVREYVRYLTFFQPPEVACTPGPQLSTFGPAACAEVRTGTAQALSALQPYLPAMREPGKTGKADVAQCYLEAWSPAVFIGYLERAAQAAGSCVRLKPGETAAYQTQDSPTSWEPDKTAYQLALNPDGRTYDARLNLKFKGPVGVGALLRRKAEACYAEAERRGMLRGPDGQSLRISLLPPGTTEPGPAEITRRGNRYRSDSANWAAGISCATILHETLHLLGLVDEYPEQAIGYRYDPRTGLIQSVEDRAEQAASDCRAVGPADSIMNDEEAAWKASRPLYPAHFRAITQPGCAAVNGLYYQCAASAYLNSRRSYGSFQCPARPRACRAEASEKGEWLR